jgi:hypothetical protein
LGNWGSGAIVHKCRVEFRRERTGLKYAVPGQRKIRRDKRKPEKFTGAQGHYIHFCNLGIPLARQIFELK